MSLLRDFVMQSTFRCYALALAASVCGSVCLAQPVKVLAPHQPIAPKGTQAFPLPPGVPGSMRGGPWFVDANYKATVYIKNSVETSSVTVTPTLYLSNGVGYKLPNVTLEAAGSAVIDVGQSLQNLGIAPYATLTGYVELAYNWPWDPICATIRDLDTKHSTIFSFGMRSSKHGRLPGQAAATPNIMEGGWWKQEAGVTGFVALANTSSRTLNAEVDVSDNLGVVFGEHPLSIAPHATKMLTLNELATAASSVGGIRVTSSGNATDLLAGGGLEDLGVGYSATIPFSYSPAAVSPSQTTVAELGLMSGLADPMMLFPAGTTFAPYTVLRNVSSSALSATPTVWWMAGGVAHSSTLATVNLPPFQSQALDVPASLAEAGLAGFSGSLQIVLDVQGNAGSLLLAGGSVDKSNTYVFEVTPHGVLESASKSLSYWSIANGDDTMVTLWNPADEAADFIFWLTYPGGHYAYPVHLDARATRSFNISEIVKSGIPDSEGNLVPAGVEEGAAKIAGTLADNQKILIVMDAGTYNVRKATCEVYCQTCDGVTSWSMIPTSFTIAANGQTQLAFHENWNTGSYYDDTSSSTWTSSNTNVAGVQEGGVISISPGSTTITASYPVSEPLYTGYWCEGSPWNCPNQSQSGSGASDGTVDDTTPVITGISPSAWKAGATTTGVAFTGQYFGTNAPKLSFSPGGGISYALSSYNDTQIVANITVASGTPNEEVSVTVTATGYGGSSFNGSGVGQSATSSAVYATVHAPINSPEITVIGWVDGNFTLPTGENATLLYALNNSSGIRSALCAATVAGWVVKMPGPVVTAADTAYANAWNVQNSGNYNSASNPPPTTISPASILAAGNYRLFNDWGNSKGSYNIGMTPDPCKTGKIPGWLEAGQASQYEGASGTSASGKVFQISEGRVGQVGQAAYATINSHRTVPWIYSAIEFDSSGNPYYSTVSMFPTYSVYVNGVLKATYPQSSVAAFFAYTSTYQLTPSQVP